MIYQQITWLKNSSEKYYWSKAVEFEESLLLTALVYRWHVYLKKI